MSFALPITFFGTILGFLTVVSYIPGFLEISHQSSLYVLHFLEIFGDGKPLQGMITLGVTLSIVGVLLDIFNFYRYQSVRDKDFSQKL